MYQPFIKGGVCVTHGAKMTHNNDVAMRDVSIMLKRVIVRRDVSTKSIKV
jgi:hypothetical protein